MKYYDFFLKRQKLLAILDQYTVTPTTFLPVKKQRFKTPTKTVNILFKIF